MTTSPKWQPLSGEKAQWRMLTALEAQGPVMLSSQSVSFTGCVSGPEFFPSHRHPDLCNDGIGQDEDVLQTSLLPSEYSGERKSPVGEREKAEVYSKDLAPPQTGL